VTTPTQYKSVRAAALMSGFGNYPTKNKLQNGQSGRSPLKKS